MSFLDRFKEHKQTIDNKLELFLASVVNRYKQSINANVYQEIFDYVMRGGKRLRALALFMAYKAVGGQNEDTAHQLSICVELLHNSTLVHDDIIDKDEKRRNAPTFHIRLQEFYKLFDDENKEKIRRFGESAAILAGNILYELGLEVISHLQIPDKIKSKLVEIYASTYRKVNEGQLLDLDFENRFDITEKEYYEMVQFKTGALFEAAVLMGVTLAQGSAEQIDTFISFGIPAFTAFQVQDDVLGAFGTDQWGKNIDSDLREGKRTLLVIKTLEKLKDEERDFFISTLGNQNATSEELERVRHLIKSSGALDYAKATAKELITRAKQQLTIEPSLKKEGLEFFEAFADFLISRTY
ncbi:MAG: polyprenyl synthetase family protein [Promethearchaeota archaeon]